MSDAVSQLELGQLHAMLEEIRAQLASVSERVTGLENLAAPARQVVAAAKPAMETPAIDSSVAVRAGITEEEVLAISAALAAWLGVQPHIRQIRLIRTSGWAQQGRVTIQSSHSLLH